jgi:protein associated with RNAse G/E
MKAAKLLSSDGFSFYFSLSSRFSCARNDWKTIEFYFATLTKGKN